jgi:hypothetical protein
LLLVDVWACPDRVRRVCRALDAETGLRSVNPADSPSGFKRISNGHVHLPPWSGVGVAVTDSPLRPAVGRRWVNTEVPTKGIWCMLGIKRVMNSFLLAFARELSTTKGQLWAPIWYKNGPPAWNVE